MEHGAWSIISRGPDLELALKSPRMQRIIRKSAWLLKKPNQLIAELAREHGLPEGQADLA